MSAWQHCQWSLRNSDDGPQTVRRDGATFSTYRRTTINVSLNTGMLVGNLLCQTILVDAPSEVEQIPRSGAVLLQSSFGTIACIVPVPSTPPGATFQRVSRCFHL